MTRRAGAAMLLLAAGGVLALSGCTPTVTVDPAPQATAVACASVIVALPPTVGTASIRETDSQGTAAWGNPVSVVLRCGVAQPAPNIHCVPFEGVDWVEDFSNGGKTYTLTTFGRTPAVEVVIDAVKNDADAVMAPVSSAVKSGIPKQGPKKCT